MVLVSTVLLLRGLSILLLSLILLGCLGVQGFAFESVRVGFLQFVKHFLTVLGALQASMELFDLIEDHLSELWIDDVDYLLKNVVTKDMGHEFSYNPSQTDADDTRVVTDLVDDCLVIPEVGSLEDLGDLLWGLSGLKALLDDI